MKQGFWKRALALTLAVVIVLSTGVLDSAAWLLASDGNETPVPSDDVVVENSEPVQGDTATETITVESGTTIAINLYKVTGEGDPEWLRADTWTFGEGIDTLEQIVEIPVVEGYNFSYEQNGLLQLAGDGSGTYYASFNKPANEEEAVKHLYLVYEPATPMVSVPVTMTQGYSDTGNVVTTEIAPITYPEGTTEVVSVAVTIPAAEGYVYMVYSDYGMIADNGNGTATISFDPALSSGSYSFYVQYVTFAEYLAADEQTRANFGNFGVLPLDLEDPATNPVDTYIFMNGEAEVSRQNVKNGETVYVPEAPAQEGYKFLGWQLAGTDTLVTDSFTATVAEGSQTLTYSAAFEQVYYVFFMNNEKNAAVAVTKEGKSGDVITADASFPVNADEQITGWYLDQGLTQSVESVTLENANVTLWPKVEKGYWITFDSVGGTYIAPQFFAPSVNTAKPADPKKDGYTFQGWFTADGTEFTFGGQLTASVTIQAKWQAGEAEYTVIHWLENADNDEYSFHEAQEGVAGITGEVTNATANTYNGFTAEEITQQTIAGDNSTIVNVYYQRNKYTVYFYSSDETSCGQTQSFGGPGGGPGSSSNNGHRHSESCYKKELYSITAKHGAFIGDKWPTTPNALWYVDYNSNTLQSYLAVMPIGGEDFWAYGSGNTNYVATYYVQVLPGETGEKTTSDGISYKVHHQDKVSGSGGLWVTDEERYELTGFENESNKGTQNGESYQNSEFYYLRKQYQIQFVNGGSVDSTKTYYYEQSIADADYTPSNKPVGTPDVYEFQGWYDNNLGEGDPYVFEGKTMPAESITLYAKWGAPEFDGTIHLTMAGTGDTIEIDIPYDSKIDETTLPSVESLGIPEGYTWRGWCLKEGDKYTPFNFDTQIRGDITLYPYYTSSTAHSVIYDLNGGTGEVLDIKTYMQGAYADVQSASGVTAPSGQVFVGWVDEDGTLWQPGDKIQIQDEDVKLTAKWTTAPKPTKLIYDPNGGIGEQNISYPRNNEVVTLKSATELGYTRVGYKFLGWSTASNDTQIQYSAGEQLLINGEGATLYAIWEKVEFQVSYQFTNNGPEGVTVPAGGKYTVGQEVTVATTTAPVGWIFDGWYKDDKKVTEFAMPANDVVLTGTWTELNYTLSYLFMGTVPDGAVLPNQQTGLRYNESANVVTPAAVTGYEFGGWYTDEALTNPAGDTVTMTGDMTLYGKWTTKEFTVKYEYTGEVPQGAPELPGEKVYAYGAEVTVAPKAELKGYTFSGWTTDDVTVDAEGKFTMPAKDVTLKGSWAANTDTAYTVEHYLEGQVDDVFKKDETATQTLTGTTGELTNAVAKTYEGFTAREFSQETIAGDGSTIVKIYYDRISYTVTYQYENTAPTGAAPLPAVQTVKYGAEVAIEEDATATGYTFSGWKKDGKDAENFTMPAENVVITGSWTVNAYNVTVNYIWGTPEQHLKVLATETKTVDYGTEYTAEVKTFDGYTEKSGNDRVLEKVEVDGNVINIYYYKNMTLTANSGEFKYNGNEQTVTGYTVSEANVTFGKEVSASGSGTDAGNYVVNFSEDAIGAVSTDDLYKVTGTTPGELKITKRDVTLTSATESKTYDGTALTNDVVSVGGDGFAKDEGATYDVTGSQTDAGNGKNTFTYTLNAGTKAENYNITKTEGTLTVNKRNVTLTSATDSKEYDGTALTNNEIAVSGDGFAKDEGATYDVTGSQTLVGSSANSFTYTLNTNTKTENYNITKVEGTLTVTDRAEKYEITVVANSKTEKYDGTAKSVSGFETLTFEVEGNTYTVSGLSASATGTDAGNYTAEVTGTAVVKDAAGNDVTVQFTVNTENGSLIISKRAVTLTSATDYKQYDGKPLTNDAVAVSGDGFAKDEGATYNVTGSQTLVGSSENIFTYTLNANTKAENYEITQVVGTLTVTDRTEKYEITVVANSGSKTYDGDAMTVSGFNSLEFEVDGNTYTVADLSASATETDAGTYPVDVTGTAVVKDAKGNDVTDQFTVKTADGSLVISKRAVTLTSASDTKEYDGTALTNATVTAEGFVDGEGATYNVTGSQTLVGSSKNIFTYADGTAKLSNYDVTVIYGTLEVTEPEDLGDEFTKTHIDKEYKLNETVEFTITVKNIYEDARTLTLTELNNVKFTAYQVGNGEKLAVENGTNVLTVANVTGGEVVTATAVFTVTEADLLAEKNTFTNTVTAKWGNGKDYTETDDVKLEEPEYGFDIVKKADKETAKIGETINYTITVTNTGNQTIEVLVEDALLNLTRTVEVAPGTPVEITGSYTVKLADMVNGKVTNIAIGTYGDEEPKESDEVVVDVENTLTITAAKMRSDVVIYNGEEQFIDGVESITYKLTETGEETTVNAVGDGELTEIEIGGIQFKVESEGEARGENAADYQYGATTVTLSNGEATATINDPELGSLIINKRDVYVTSMSAEKDFDNQPLTAHGVDYADATETTGLVKGQEIAYSYTGSQTLIGSSENYFAVDAEATKALENGANLNNYNVDLTNGTLTVKAAPYDFVDKELAEGETVPEGGYKLGDVIDYQITVVNIFAVPAKVTVHEKNGFDLYYEDVLVGTSHIVDNVAPGAELEFTVKHTVTEADLLDAGDIVNEVNAELKTKIGTSEDDDKVEVEDEEAKYGFDIVKKAEIVAADGTAKDKAQLGDTINYTITVTNTGNQTITVQVDDELLNLNDVAVEVAPGASKEVTGSYIVTLADMVKGKVTNIATGTYKDEAPKESNEVEVEVENTLTITAAKMRSDVVIYNGEEQFIDGVESITVQVAEGVTATANATATEGVKEITLNFNGERVTFQVSSTGVAKGTDAKDAYAYEGGATVTVANGEATKTIENPELGSLIINKRNVYVTSKSAEKNFDNQPLTAHGVDYADATETTGLVKGQEIAYSYTGSQTLIGSSENYFTVDAEATKALENGANLNNYNVVPTNGTLTVKAAPYDFVDKELAEGETVPEGGYKLGDVIDYQITVVNIFAVPAKVTVHEKNGFDLYYEDVLVGTSHIVDNVAPGAELEFTVKHTVTEADLLDAGDIVNEVNAVLDAGVAPLADDDTVTVDDEEAKYGFDIKKEADKATAKIGDTINYTITVTNTGNQTIKVLVEDALLNLTRTVEVAPGTPEVINGSYTVKLADMAAGQVTNVATGTYDDGDPDTEDTKETNEVVVDIENTLEITNAVMRSAEHLYDGAEHQISGVESITVQVAEGITATANATATEGVKEITVNFNGERVTFAVTSTGEAKGTDAAEDAYAYEGGATVTVANGEATKTIDNPELGALKINKRTLLLSVGGDTKVYPAVASNNNVESLLVGPAGTDYAWQRFDGFADGESFTYSEFAELALVGSIENTFTISDGTAKQSNYDVKVINGTLVVTNDDNFQIVDKAESSTPTEGSYSLGEVMEFSITVTNIYNAEAALTITEQDGVTIRPQAGITVSADGKTATGTMTPGQVLTVYAEYTVQEADLMNGSFTNEVEATLNATVNEIEIVDPHEDTEEIEELDETDPELTIEKVTVSAPAANGTYAVGETIRYEITATNTGNLTLTDVMLTDTLTSLEGETAEQLAQTALNEEGFTLAPNESRTFTYEYTVTEDDLGKTIRNEATGTANNPVPPVAPVDPENPENPEPGKPTEIIPGITEDETEAIRHEMTVEKSVVDHQEIYEVDPELQVIRYQIVVTNSGNVTETNIAVEDVITGISEPANFQFTDLDGGVLVGNTVTFATMAPGATHTILCEYQLTEEDDGSIISNVANVTTDDITDPTSDEAEDAQVRERFTLFVVYLDENGEPVLTFVDRVAPGTIFTVVSPIFENYTAEVAQVQGVMPANDHIINVNLIPNDAEEAPVEPIVVQEPVAEYDLTPLFEEETPLANVDLGDHSCCILHFLIMLAAMIILGFYTKDRKQRQARIFELRKELAMEEANRETGDGKEA